MAAFNTSNTQAGSQQVLTSTHKTQVALTAATATLTSAALVAFDIGTDTAPADNVLTWDVSRVTTTGTGSAATPSPTDGSKRAAGTVSTVNQTAEPSLGVSLWAMPLNQRASFRWVAVPGGELIIPATNNAGVAIRAKSPAYVSTVVATAEFTE
jgi:hypothetical protein